MSTFTVNTTQVQGTVIEGRQCLTTEADCPICEARNAYRHVESHASIGRWYGCQHLKACNYDGAGFIESIEFS